MSVALVTGGNRGIGLEVCRQLARDGHEVILGSRDREKGAAVAGGLRVVQLDVADAASVRRAAEEIDALDILVNNAAILYDTWARAASADLDEVHDALETNLFGAWRTTQAFLPHLRRSAHAARASTSPARAARSERAMSGGTPAYSVSKARPERAHPHPRAGVAEPTASSSTRSAPAGPTPTWARAGGPSSRARRASCGRPSCPTTGRPAASSATAPAARR